MIVNGINISSFSGKLLTVDIQTSLKNESEWIKKALSPNFLNNTIDFKIIKLELLFKGNSRDEILNNISNFISKFIAPVDINLQKYSHSFKCILSDQQTIKTVSSRAYKKSITLIGYEYGSEIIETANRITSKTINIPGNLETPAIVEITPSVNIIDLAVTGLGENFTIKNLTAGQKVIINGEDGTVLQNGVNKFLDYDGWDFPRLKTGANTITFSKGSCDITIKYKPRFI